MMLNREEALKVVTGGLSWIVKVAELRGTIHLFDSHIISQEVYLRLLNELHGLQLEVTNSIHQSVGPEPELLRGLVRTDQRLDDRCDDPVTHLAERSRLELLVSA